MKKTLFLFILSLTISFSAFAQINKKVDMPEALGMYAFKLLQNFENTSDKEFIYSLLTLEELKAYTTKHVDAEESYTKREINRLTTEEYHAKITKEYTELQENAKTFKIKWSAIEFVDFTYEEKAEDGFTGIQGKLFFKHNNVTYRTKVDAFLMEDKYAPLIVRSLIEKNIN
ncbi:hypothetical protein KORDIASMS9_03192 [Kordia sp. SMS9]|uniref:hypothetical protein n=1 Tax=Kordia sp. SMS9 TaxID=2282170 RepID=UPI000E104067|nr:hypothetical protein [Kordia sp. SMS9]AXG70937.1 hypothetical protein KORDIASMS9_03192 [Kordia sp. SMS9]